MINLGDFIGQELIEKKELLVDDEIPVELVFDSIYTFVMNLPYSMDPANDSFIDSVLYIHFPADGERYSIFRCPPEALQQTNLFLSMVSWRDTRRTAYSILLCCLFQQMLCGRVSSDYEIDEETFNVWGVSDEYKKIITSILKKIPEYYRRVIQSTSFDERNEYLKDIYGIISHAFGQHNLMRDFKMFCGIFSLPYQEVRSNSKIKHLSKVQFSISVNK